MDKMRRNNSEGFGKLPPQAVDIEEAVLGSIIEFPQILSLIVHILNENSFYKECHSLIWKAIIELESEGAKIDSLSVVHKLKTKGELDLVGGAYYIVTLTNKSIPNNVEYHAAILKQQQIKREIISESSKFIAEAFDDTSDSLELLANFQTSADNIASGAITKKSLTNNDIHRAILKSYNEPENESSVKSGLHELDRILKGFHNTDLIVLAARPGMGKTSLALTIATNANLRFDIPILIFSLEMSAIQLGLKQQSIHTGIPLERIRDKKTLTQEDFGIINAKIGSLLEGKIFYEDNSTNIIELRAKAKQHKNKNKIGLIVIDYLQLIDGKVGSHDKSNREQEISYISRSLKALAKDLNIPIIALSQLSRGVESRGGEKVPMLSDLRDSGAIEQDADVVMFIHRPEYYGIFEDENGNSIRGMAKIIVAKHRNGALDNAIVKFDHATTGFFDMNKNEETYESKLSNKSFRSYSESNDAPF